MAVFKGKIKKVGVFELKDPKEFKGKLQTHRYAIQVEEDENGNVPADTWISMGNGDKADFVFQDSEDDNKWKILGEGSYVKIVYEQNGTYYNSGKSKVTIIDFVEGQRFAKAASSIPKKDAGGPVNEGGKKSLAAPSGGYKKDNTGMEVGHALNSAVIALKVSGKAIDEPADMLEVAKLFHDATTKLKAEHKEKNPSLSDYDAGAAVGHAIKFAAELFQEGDDVERILELARWMLNDVSPVLTDYVKNGGVKEKKAPAKKEPAKKAEKKEAPVPANDLDDLDIPF